VLEGRITKGRGRTRRRVLCQRSIATQLGRKTIRRQRKARGEKRKKGGREPAWAHVGFKEEKTTSEDGCGLQKIPDGATKLREGIKRDQEIKGHSTLLKARKQWMQTRYRGGVPGKVKETVY